MLTLETSIYIYGQGDMSTSRCLGAGNVVVFQRRTLRELAQLCGLSERVNWEFVWFSSTYRKINREIQKASYEVTKHFKCNPQVYTYTYNHIQKHIIHTHTKAQAIVSVLQNHKGFTKSVATPEAHIDWKVAWPINGGFSVPPFLVATFK